MKADYKIILAPTYKCPGLVRDNNTGNDFNVWKAKRAFSKTPYYEDADGNKYASVVELINRRGAA